jgi:hypothetical protein
LLNYSRNLSGTWDTFATRSPIESAILPISSRIGTAEVSPNPEEPNGYFNYAINSVSILTTAQAVPEPFSILGTLFGGAAALKMRRKFKATNKL